MAEEFKKLTGRVQSVEGGKGIEGLNYEDLCIQLEVELPNGYKPAKFEMFDSTGDSKVHLRTYYEKLVGVGKNEQIRMNCSCEVLQETPYLGISVKTQRSGIRFHGQI